ncbi:Peptidase, M23/M37 family [hydrothermal vent metagenome]|uniref:Peptidase, M23/M37 family n=1 Tax=hydrothermal vent metagenome TaxID=652676 RepID=A0A3B1DA46_9ZZZZ
MTPDRPRFWKSIPFLISSSLILLSYLGFWILSKPETLSESTRVSETQIQKKATSPSGIDLLPQTPTPIISEPEPIVKEHRLKKGDTLSRVLSHLGVSHQEIYDITTASKKVYNLKKIHPGQTIAVTFDANAQQVAHFSYEIDPLHSLEIAHNEGQFVAEKKAAQLEKSIERRSGVITDTLYDSAKRFGVPPEIILDLSDIFAWDIDFGNEIRVDDRFKLVYEVFKKDGQIVKTGRVLAAQMTSRRKTYQAYYFEAEGTRGDYYNAEGRSLRKAFMKSPLRYRYISSGYATRRLHPVLKVNRPHLGIDFAAKRGTPVRAAGDGVISFVGNNGGYGKSIIIKHKNGYKTLYGHLSAFARGIKKGKRVKQEDFIGRVGSTGLSTGPHLHYTLYKNGKAINPRKADVLRGEALPKKWRAVFSDLVKLMNQSLSPAPDLLATTDSL